MRTTLGAGLGAGLALAVSVGVGLVVPSAQAAAPGCDGGATTTWVGPTTSDGSPSWGEPANWTDGVPDATSVVCIPDTLPSPVIGSEATADVIDAAGSTVTLQGELTVGTHFDVAVLTGPIYGELHGPGVTTVTDALAGYLELSKSARIDLGDGVSLEADLEIQDGSRVNVTGDVRLQPGTDIDSLDSDRPGLLTITETGSLTLHAPGGSADLTGGFANHGEVRVLGGSLLMLGTAGESFTSPDEFSTGSFTQVPEATLIVANAELRTGAVLARVRYADHLTVPAENMAVARGTRISDGSGGPGQILDGAGTLQLTDGSRLEGGVGGSLTLQVPEGETAEMGEAVVQDRARVRVDGELVQDGTLHLDDDSVLAVHGVHRGSPGGGVVGFTGDDPGRYDIAPGGRLTADDGGSVFIVVPFVNQGTVDSGDGYVHIGPEAASAAPSTGGFRSGAEGRLELGPAAGSGPPLELDGSLIEGPVRVTGEVRAHSARVSGQVSTAPAHTGAQPGSLTLTGATTLSDGASLTGDVTVAGHLEADAGPGGTATLSGAEVPGSVRVASGVLSVPSLGQDTLLGPEGTLARGEWSVAPGARLELPAFTTNQTALALEGVRASLVGPTALVNGAAGVVALQAGADLRLPGTLRNDGRVELGPGSRLVTQQDFRQTAGGTVVTALDAAGQGRIRVEGRRDLAGTLEVRRVRGFRPPVGTVRTVVTSRGKVGRSEGFDRFVSPRYGSRRLLARYGPDRVRLRVVRMG